MIEPTSISQLSPADRARMRLRDLDLIEICASCRRVGCASEQRCCKARAEGSVGTLRVPFGEVRKDPQEHASYWIEARAREGHDFPDRLAITPERLGEIEERCKAISSDDTPTWCAVPCPVRFWRPEQPSNREGRWVIVPTQDPERLPLAEVDYAESSPLEYRLYAEAVARFLAEAGADVPDLAREVRESWAREEALRARVAELERR